MRYEFESAIRHNVDEVREETWKGVFHHGLPNLYGIFASIAYLIYDTYASPTIPLPQSFPPQPPLHSRPTHNRLPGVVHTSSRVTPLFAQVHAAARGWRDE